MGAFLIWLATVEVLGLLAWPVAFRLLRSLPDRGHAFAKPLGLLLPAYLLWLLSSFGVLPNTRAGIVVALLVWALFAWAWGPRGEIIPHGRAGYRQMIFSEALFILAFAVAALYRAYDPDISHTEQPMELAFLNAILRSERMPPHDPWLAGYAISYYYFGYFIVAFLAQLTGVPAAVAFNLALALVFGLAVQGAFGVVYNLVAAREGRAAAGLGRPAVYGVAGAGMLTLLGNLEGVLEVLRARNLVPTSFWRWLDIEGLQRPYPVAQWLPTDPPDTWWWWRATRVIGTYGPSPQDPARRVALDYTINEFPFFSFLLGDLHPHVLALPFGLLALGLGLACLLSHEDLGWGWARRHWLDVGLVVLCLGALGFLNSWDFPTYLFLFVIAWGLQRGLRRGRLDGRLVGEALACGGLLLALGVALYLPFYAGFSSQATGLGVVLVRTRLVHFLIFWGPLLFVALSYLALLGGPIGYAGGAISPSAWGRRALALGAGLWLGLLVFLQAWVALLLLGVLVTGIWWLGPKAVAAAVPAARPPLAAVPGRGRRGSPSKGPPLEVASVDLFALVLVLAAFLLMAVPEFAFVRDLFGNRMNTVFKLYYQGWLLLAVASGYVLYFVNAHWASPRGVRLAWQVGLAVLVAASLIYPLAAPFSKARGFAGPPTLDGSAWLQRARAQEYEALQWLKKAGGAEEVVLEAAGPSYNPLYGRVATFTGLPAVLGWPWHETQWRGSGTEPARRKADIDTIYTTPHWATAERLLRQYRVAFVFVGDTERAAYAQAPPGALAKFERFMEVAYRNATVTIYRWKSVS